MKLVRIFKVYLLLDEEMAVLSSDSPVESEVYVTITQRILGRVSGLDLMLLFGVGRSTLHNCFQKKK